MHDVLAKIVTREADKLLKLSTSQETPLSESSLESLEILSRCAKALKNDKLPVNTPPEPELSDEEGLSLLGGGGG